MGAELLEPGLYPLFVVFWGGVLSSLTPCVYPLIPVTLAIFGATNESSRRKAFALSLTYVLGIAFTYTLLGMVCAKTGIVFGSFLGNPWIVALLALFILLLALYTLDIIPINFLHLVQTKAGRLGGKGFSGAFVMGAVSGVVAAPCVGPVLVVVLGIAAASQNVFWGAALLLCYSLGMGVLFVLLGTYSGLIQRIPRSGNWLLGVKLLIASLLLVALWILAAPFLGRYLPDIKREMLLAIVLLFLILAVLAGVWGLKRNLRSLRFASAILTSLVFSLGLSGFTAPSQELKWLTSFDAALQTAQQLEKPLMIDLFADWCAACKELDSLTFSDATVQQALSALVLGRVDFTTESDETIRIQEKYEVIGLPCVLFLSKEGIEIPESRLTGFLGPQEFLRHVERVLKRHTPPAS